MANIEELHDKIVSNQLTDDDKFKIQNILEQVSRQREIKSINSKKYFERIKDNDEIMNRIRQQKMVYYTNNRDKLNEKDRIKYHENLEFKERKKEQSRLNYHKKNDDVPKMTRGRKKKEINPDEPPKVVRPRGRPKLVESMN
jgi:hypothetical protein